MWHLKQKIKVKETIMNKMSAKKVRSEAENKEIVMNKLGLSWDKFSLSWGLKLKFEAEV